MAFSKSDSPLSGKNRKVPFEQRALERVACSLRGEFFLDGLSAWLPMEVLDLSAAGMKVRFDSVFRDVRLREEQFNWTDSRFRFLLKGEFFILSGYFLRIYKQERGYFTVGVEFSGPEPEDQFKLAALYRLSVRRN